MNHSLRHFRGLVRIKTNEVKKMNRLFRFNNKAIIVLFLLKCVLLIQYKAYGQNDTHREYLTALKLVNRMSKEYPYSVTNDENGLVVSLAIQSKYASDETLRAISKIESIRNLKIFGTLSGALTPTFTSNSISELRHMSHLTSLGFACFNPIELPPGALSSATGITQLQNLYLYHAQPINTDEYRSITNITNLKSLQVNDCLNFGDKEVQIATNLPKVSDLRQSRRLEIA